MAARRERGRGGTRKVMLGSPELTAGIPGEGPLTIEELKPGLNDPANHKRSKSSCRWALAAGAAQIKGSTRIR